MNLWPDFSNIEKITSPKEILEEQSNYLGKLTNDTVYASVEQLSILDPYANSQYDFSYSFHIRGKFLENYKFRVFTICHNIVIYPMSVRLDSEIYNELIGVEEFPTQINCEKEFLDMLKLIFSSEKVRRVISSIYSLSK